MSCWKDKSWTEAALDYHKQRGQSRTVIEIEPARLRRLRRLLNDNVSFERAWHELHADHFRGRAAQTTVEALMYSLRERGTKALAEPDTKRRIGELSEEQLHEVGGRLQRLKPEIAKPWTPDEVRSLLAAWMECHAK
jgi:hypothetical protein